MTMDTVKTTFSTSARFQKVAPEGGWGYIVMIGFALSYTLSLGALPCFALLFGDFIKNLGRETSAVTTVTSCYFLSFSFFGLFAKFLFHKFSALAVARAGGLLFLTGSFLTIGVTSIWQLVITYGILQGLGFGVILSVSFTRFNQYFVKKRILMMSLTQGIIGIGSICLPIMIEKMMQAYGFRGCLAILAAINGHALFGMMVMHPVEWHLKIVEIPIEELCEREVKVEEKPDDITPDQQLLCSDESYHSSSSNSSLNRIQYSLKRNASMVSLGSYATGVPVDDAVSINVSRDPKGLWTKIVDFLDLTLLKDLIYVNLAMGMTIVLYSDITFFAITPLYLFQLGYTKAAVAQIISICAGCDLLSRFFLAAISSCKGVTARNIFLWGTIFTIFARFVFLYVKDYLFMAIIMGTLGIFKAWVHVPIAIVLSDHLPMERFPSGNGLFMSMQGVVSMIMGPLVGWIRDYTQSYVLTFHCLTFMMVVCSVTWIIEDMWRICRRNGAEKVNNITVMQN